MKENEDKKEIIDKQLRNKAREEMNALDEHIEDAYKHERLLDEDVETAFQIRSSRIEKTLKLRREIEEIYTPIEKLEIELLKVQIENKRKEAALKGIEIDSKKIDLEFKRKELEALGDE